MNKRPLEIFGYRDFTLALLQIGLEAESRPLPHLENHKPIRPYFVGKRENGKTGLYIDMKQVEWQKEKILEKIKTDVKYADWLLRSNENEYFKIEALFKESRALTSEEFKGFVENVRVVWQWYAGLWWEIEILEQRNIFPEILDKSMAFRTKTHEFCPIADNIIRLTIKKLYPELAAYTDFIRFEEIINDTVPSVEELEERIRSYLYLDGKICVGTEINKVLEASGIELTLPKTKDHQKEDGILKGQIAYKGKVTGKVSIVFTKEESNRFIEGNILVSSSTIPDFIYAIQRAGAIVTDEGGIMSHAAILSRELKKPCVIGTKVATQVLKDGNMVEVDADKGVVKILK